MPGVRESGEVIRVGISACLLGKRVRYDGGHKLESSLRDVLGRNYKWVPVCPEFEAGLGVPREPLRPEGGPQRPRLVGTRTHRDWTGCLRAWAARRLDELEKLQLCGFIFKTKSPTCGLGRLKVYSRYAAGRPRPAGSGLFAAAFLRRFPLIPAADEVRLRAKRVRDYFLECVWAYACLRKAASASLPHKRQNTN